MALAAGRLGARAVLRPGVAVLRLRNPPVNSLSLELLTELLISLEKLENDRTLRGTVITSDCPGVFSAGLDLLEGACPAGGYIISLSCDHRVLADNPKYTTSLNETLLGIVAPFWLKNMLVNTVGHRAAERALQLGLLLPPAEALRVGLVDQVVPEEQVQAAALSEMARWTSQSQGHGHAQEHSRMRGLEGHGVTRPPGQGESPKPQAATRDRGTGYTEHTPKN